MQCNGPDGCVTSTSPAGVSRALAGDVDQDGEIVDSVADGEPFRQLYARLERACVGLTFAAGIDRDEYVAGIARVAATGRIRVPAGASS